MSQYLLPSPSTAGYGRDAEIEDRLALLDRLKRKYGHAIDEVIAFSEDVARKLAEVEDTIARSLRLKILLQNLLQCRCTSLKQCVAALGLIENLRFVSGRSSSVSP